MFWRSSRLGHLLVIAAVVLLTSISGAWAQGYGALMDEMSPTSYNTANLQTAEPWPEGSTLLYGDVRTWEGDNWTFSAAARTNVGEDMDAEVTLFHMDTSGEDPIAGAVRDSEATLLGLNFKWVAYRGDDLTISVIPGAEFPIDDMEGTNTAIPATATSDDIIPTITVPFEFTSEAGTIYRVGPRYIGFDEAPQVGDATIDGFGDVIALAGGATHDFGEYSLLGDLAIVLAGDNSIDENTNAPTDEFVWSLGGAWHPEDNDVRVDLFVTNAAGPTAASSIIATPDSSVGVGVRVSGEF
jgi:hypothetical protein